METFFPPKSLHPSATAAAAGSTPWFGVLNKTFDSVSAMVGLDTSHPSATPDHECHVYEQYAQLSDLSYTWQLRIWPDWGNEPALRPALHALELTFRLIYALTSDTRPYVDRDQWLTRLESLVSLELEVVALLSEGDSHAPTISPHMQLHANNMAPVSQETLLARIASGGCGSEAVWKLVNRIQLGVECQMMRAPFTLGLGEPNHSGKPVLCYDTICNPARVYETKPHGYNGGGGNRPEDHTLCTVHQILECWMAVSQSLLWIINEKASLSSSVDLPRVARLSCIVERIWRIASSTTSLLILMDPNDFMKLKQRLTIDCAGPAYCLLQSRRLRSVTKACKNLRHLLPKVVGVEADPKGGPRLQEAVMDLLLTHGHNGYVSSAAAVHVLQSFQSIEMSLRQFYFSYEQLLVSVMGSVEFKSSRAVNGAAAVAIDSTVPADVISEIYLEPPYFPSLDGAKIFLDDYWHHRVGEPSIGQLATNQRVDEKWSVSSSMWTDSDNGSSLLSEEGANQS